MTTKTKNKSWYEIKAQDNAAHITIHGVIGDWGVSSEDFEEELKAIPVNSDAVLHIHSDGGSVIEGYAIYIMLKRHFKQITTVVDGIAASMGSYLFMLGSRRVIPANGWLMIHSPKGGRHGSPEENEAFTKFLYEIKNEMVSIYAGGSNLSEDEVIEMMKVDTWIRGDKAVEMGLATELEAEVDIAAQLQIPLSGFKNVPDAIEALNDKSSDKSSEIAVKLNLDTADANLALDNIENRISNLSAVAGTNQLEGNMPNKENPVVEPTAAIDDAVKAALALEETRKTEILGAFGEFAKDHGELLNGCLLDSKVTVADAQAKLLKAMGEGVTPVGSVIVTSADDQAKGAINAMKEVLASRVGLKHESLESNPFRGSSLLDMAGQCLAKRGVSTSGLSKLDIVGAAFTHSSSDFSSILSNTANKSMLRGYDETEETFEQFTSIGSLPDFKQATRVDLNEAPSLRQVREGAEYKSITMGDRGETVQLATYGELFAITRQAIINDDLSAFTRIPQKMGRAARRTVGDLVWAIITGNPNMSDGTALFHAGHSNVATSAALSAANLDALRVLMATQKGAGGTANLNISPSYLLVPNALKSTALQLMASETDPSKNNSKLPNIVNGLATVIADSRLDTASATTYYLAASQAFDTIEVQYLDGNSSPFLEQQNGWNVDGVEFKVRIDAGAKALDHRTMARGTA